MRQQPARRAPDAAREVRRPADEHAGGGVVFTEPFVLRNPRFFHGLQSEATKFAELYTQKMAGDHMYKNYKSRCMWEGGEEDEDARRECAQVLRIDERRRRDASAHAALGRRPLQLHLRRPEAVLRRPSSSSSRAPSTLAPTLASSAARRSRERTGSAGAASHTSAARRHGEYDAAWGRRAARASSLRRGRPPRSRRPPARMRSRRPRVARSRCGGAVAGQAARRCSAERRATSSRPPCSRRCRCRRVPRDRADRAARSASSQSVPRSAVAAARRRRRVRTWACVDGRTPRRVRRRRVPRRGRSRNSAQPCPSCGRAAHVRERRVAGVRPVRRCWRQRWWRPPRTSVAWRGAEALRRCAHRSLRSFGARSRSSTLAHPSVSWRWPCRRRV